jgi:two-component system phosphate regulon sensor histidine kinase PhoR
LQVCEVKASGKGIVIDVECPEDILIRANAPLLEQAIVNLAENAVKFSNPDSRISVKAARMNAKTVISVQDYGAGIEKRHLPGLFERFYRVDQGWDTRSGGTGLGLAIVKHIAMLHNGEVNVTSTLGVGSIFSILLPSRRNE